MRNLLSLLILVAFPSVATVAADPVPIIFDTDMAGDCDDAGALAVLNALADRGEAQILAVVTNRKCAAGVSGGASDAINTFYGRPDIPIGTDKDGAKVRWNKPSTYTPTLFGDFPHDSPVDSELPDALDVYRKTLATAQDNSVVICSVGALSNLEDLLNSSGDGHSPLTGIQLIDAKVRQTVIMGGEFPRSSHPETNLKLDPPAAVAVVHEWPGPILWQGFEIGAALHCGAKLKDASADNPIRRAFALRPYLGGFAIDHGKPAHDQAAVLLAVRGIEPEWWTVSGDGRVVVDSDGHTRWYSDPRMQHRYVSIKGRPDGLANIIEELMRK
ncbi:Inosine-uridine preferring nucleoside hydrolase [Stieleria neptunia]|uniref:Inosine-uridine preferring nucleoside hydrolase n=1 Tax=Stieleria neptunia TaxID=2527979 RepID=A0A518HK48_9BACT|nr:nucleoside hydrolase [Stieleria neptunia]QDV41232.1 Inosine-uridine preferring nucleoside hydrolase [Stieleria neptunia]